MTAYQPSFAPVVPVTELPVVANLATTSTGKQAMWAVIGGYRRLIVYESRCHVCSAAPEVYDAVANMAGLAVTVKRMIEVLAKDGVTLKDGSLRTHIHKHLGIPASYATLVRASAQAFGEDDPMRVSGLHASQAILELGMQQLANGMEVKPSDIIAAARFQHDLDSVETSAAEASLYGEAFQILLGVFYKAVGPAKFQSVMYSMTTHPRMSEILASLGHRGVTTMASDVIDVQDAESRELAQLVRSF